MSDFRTSALRMAGCLFFLLLVVRPLAAQQVLRPESYLHRVLSTHPEMRLAAQQALLNRGFRLQVAGLQDPVLASEYDQKFFDGKDYFRIGAAGVSVPTVIGLKASVKYGWADGIFLNPENRLPSTGLGYIGLELPLGRGLWNNPMRTERRKRGPMEEWYRARAESLANDLALRAMTVYWEWALAWSQRALTEEAYALAETRRLLVVEQVVQGDLAALDSVEADLQVRQRQIELNELEASLAAAQARLTLDLLGMDAGQEVGWIPVLEALPLRQAAPEGCRGLDRHPQYRQVQARQQIAEADAALAREWIKPDLQVRASLPLTAESWRLEGIGMPYVADHYLFGMAFRTPLGMRRERGTYQVQRVTAEGLGLQSQVMLRELEAACQASREQRDLLAQRREDYVVLTRDYQRLLDGEWLRFRAGESSLFLVNLREQRWLDARIKSARADAAYFLEEWRFRLRSGAYLPEEVVGQGN